MRLRSLTAASSSSSSHPAQAHPRQTRCAWGAALCGVVGVWGVLRIEASTMLGGAAGGTGDPKNSPDGRRLFDQLHYLDDPSTYHALYYEPPQTPAHAALPVLLYLHGAGEVGTDVGDLLAEGATGTPLALLEHGTAPAALAESFLVVAPQSDTAWDPPAIAAFVEFVLAHFPADRVDARRIYVTGHSLGGAGALRVATLGKFAACAPVAPAGGVRPRSLAERRVPVWAFHGKNDVVVPSLFSERLVAGLRDAGVDEADARITLYDHAPTPPGWPRSIGHASTIPAYASADLYDWLLTDRLPDTVTPFQPRTRDADPPPRL